MNYDNFRKLPEDVKAPLLAGYSLGELDYWKNRELLKESNYSNTAVSEVFNGKTFTNTKALQDGLRLNEAIIMVFSADKLYELEKDIRDYNLLALELNKSYGEIVHTIEGSVAKLGIVGHRKAAFTEIITITRVIGETETLSVAFPSTEIEEENKKIRS